MHRTIHLRLLCLVLCCALLAGLTTAVFAREPAQRTPEFDGFVRIEGVTVTEEGFEEGAYFSDGRIAYDFDNKILTLRGDLNGGSALALYNGVAGLTIYVEKDVEVKSDEVHAMLFEADATITGPGKLTVLAGTEGTETAAICVSMDATLTLESCTAELTGTRCLTTPKCYEGWEEDGGGGLIVRSSTVHAAGREAVCGFDGGILLDACEIKAPEGAQIGSRDGCDAILDVDGAPAADVRIEPVEAPVYCTVTFDANGHGIAPAPQLIVKGMIATEPEEPTAEGWSFGGWYTEKACTNEYVFITPVTEDITLYAKWTENAPTEFSDVPENTYYTDPVSWAVENEITSGTGGGKFSPDMICSRAQIVTFLWRANGCPAPKSAEIPFSDVEAGQWYTDAVLWAVEQEITGGTGGGRFSPDAPCTRAQVVTFLYRAQADTVSVLRSGDENELPIIPTQPEPAPTFSDIAEGSYYYDAVLWAVAQGITGGTGGGKFSPDKVCSRAEIVTFLYRDLAEA